MASSKSSFCTEVFDDDLFEDSLLHLKYGLVQPFLMESCLPGNSFYYIMQDLLFFDSQIGRRGLPLGAAYRYTCGSTECNFTCGVPHLTLIVRVRGLADDQIGIIL
jgi:hypothetical protein